MYLTSIPFYALGKNMMFFLKISLIQQKNQIKVIFKLLDCNGKINSSIYLILAFKQTKNCLITVDDFSEIFGTFT